MEREFNQNPEREDIEKARWKIESFPRSIPKLRIATQKNQRVSMLIIRIQTEYIFFINVKIQSDMFHSV